MNAEIKQNNQVTQVKPKKEMNEVLKLGLILFTITAVCAGLLGAVNGITTPIIAAKKEASKQEAMRTILSDADNFVAAENIQDEMINELYIGVKDNTYVGTVAKVAPSGYGGPVEILVGINKEGKINAVQVLSHTETPGLGANAKEPKFIDQFMSKLPPLKVTKSAPADNEISAITGATITSDAVTKGVNHVAEYVDAHKSELEQEGNK